MDLFQGIRATPFQPEAIGMAVGQRFRDGIESQQVERLLAAIDHGRDSEWASFSITFGNVYPAERLRLIAVPTQSVESC
jgi:hypothetical protein